MLNNLRCYKTESVANSAVTQMLRDYAKLSSVIAAFKRDDVAEKRKRVVYGQTNQCTYTLLSFEHTGTILQHFSPDRSGFITRNG